MDAACEIAAMEADVVCVAITGAAAIRPTLAAIDAGANVATATKEVLVMAGELVKARAAASGARVIPIDSEHSALWQCLRGEDPASVSRLVLTASGGPFLRRPLDTFAAITPAEAMAHPTWNMGPKVTIDSATMMNKGLEIIEAHFLFDVPYASIDVAIQPTSIIHSWVEFRDGAVIAQLGVPDMRVPIALALADGERLPGVGPRLDLRDASPLEVLAAGRQPVPRHRGRTRRRRARRPRALRLQCRERGGSHRVHRRDSADSTRSCPWSALHWERSTTVTHPRSSGCSTADAWARGFVRANTAGAVPAR